MAVFALSLVLNLAVQLHQNAERVARLGGSIDSLTQLVVTDQLARWTRLFGHLLTQDEPLAISPVYTAHNADLTTSRQLLSVLAELRRRSRLKSEVIPVLSVQEPGLQTLFADLLRIPKDIDPIRWLQEERGTIIARNVLEYLIRQIIPSPGRFQTERGVQTHPSIRPKKKLRVRNLSVGVRQIDFYENCFVVQLDALIYTRSALKPSHTSFVRWEGFERVVDNHGYHYLTQIVDRSGSHQLWWWKEQITLLCWPSIEDADALILQSQPTALARYKFPTLSDNIIPLPSPILGDLHIRTPLKHKSSNTLFYSLT